MVNSIAVAPAADAVSNISVPSNANTNNDQTTTDEGTNNEDTEAQADDNQTRKDANKLQDALKAATKGITDFLSETALHGPKYITFKDNKAIRITWGIIFVVSVSYAINMVLEASRGWTSDQVVTNIATTQAPMSDVPFPAITACHEAPNHPEGWELPEMILNFFKLECDPYDVKCQKAVDNLIQLFQPVFNKYVDLFLSSNVILPEGYHPYLDTVGPYLNGYRGIQVGWPFVPFAAGYYELARLMKEEMQSNPKLLNDLKNRWKTSSQRFTIEILEFEYIPMGINFSNVAYEYKMYQHNYFLVKGCNDLQDEHEIWHFLMRLFHWTGFKLLGTAIRTLAVDVHLGDSFGGPSYSSFWPCPHLNTGYSLYDKKSEDFFHDLMRKISKLVFGAKVSLYEIPKIFSLSMPTKRRDFPIREFCDYHPDPEGVELLVPYEDMCCSDPCTIYWRLYMSGVKEPNMTNMYENQTLESVVDLCVDNLVQYVGIDAKSMLEIMKYEYRYGSLEDIEDLYNKVEDAELPYPLLPYADVWQAYDFGIYDISRRMERISTPKSLALDLYTNGKPDTSLVRMDAFYTESLGKSNTSFYPVLTDYGLCSTLNSKTPSEVFNGEYMEDFKSIYGLNSSSRSLETSAKKEISFIIDSRSRAKYPFDLTTETRFAMLSLNVPGEFWNVDSNKVGILKGTETLIKVKPVELISDESLRTLDVNDRNCRFEDELSEGMVLFKNYTRQSCIFECMHKYSAEECSCTPWNMPRPDNEQEPKLCTFYGNECFFSKMKNASYASENCHCEADCNRVQYEFHVETVKPMTEEKAKTLCTGDKPHVGYSKYTDATLKSFLLDSEHPEETEAEMDLKRCVHYLVHDSSVVTIQIDGSSYLQRGQSLRYTLTDKVGIVGGTLGLFTGFSLMVFVELGYWVFMIIMNVVGKIVGTGTHESHNQAKQIAIKIQDNLNAKVAKLEKILEKNQEDIQKFEERFLAMEARGKVVQ